MVAYKSRIVSNLWPVSRTKKSIVILKSKIESVYLKKKVECFGERLRLQQLESS